jgi:hypothetical protein
MLTEIRTATVDAAFLVRQYQNEGLPITIFTTIPEKVTFVKYYITTT